ncbi:alpha/beta hydrolase [Duganella sp. SAP-35]|uniref:Alpha/beta hydrolase n=2 Tax=Duganella aceris TaxID=2703883 RepID=A0ABX0FJB1_9BURK|nr:alpha/beta hydrolase [Duganella aceris]
MKLVLDALESLGGKPVESLSPDEARRQPTTADAVGKLLRAAGKGDAPAPNVTLTPLQIDGPLGKIPLYVYTPADAGKDPLPVLLYFHGGGFVTGGTLAYEASIRALASRSGAIVVSVEYHLAPEHKYPAAPNDAYAAYLWVLAHAAEFNGDAGRVAVGGEGAGGTLAAVVAQMARDKRDKPPVHQLLIYPILNDDMDTPSYSANALAKPFGKAAMTWYLTHYTAAPTDADDAYAMPTKAKSLRRLPSATIITAAVDPLASEGRAYAYRLQKDKVAVSFKEYAGMSHDFFGMGAVLPAAREAQEFAAERLKRALRSQATPATPATQRAAPNRPNAAAR